MLSLVIITIQLNDYVKTVSYVNRTISCLCSIDSCMNCFKIKQESSVQTKCKKSVKKGLDISLS